MGRGGLTGVYNCQNRIICAKSCAGISHFSYIAPKVANSRRLVMVLLCIIVWKLPICLLLLFSDVSGISTGTTTNNDPKLRGDAPGGTVLSLLPE